jgi:hypothetical protein
VMTVKIGAFILMVLLMFSAAVTGCSDNGKVKNVNAAEKLSKLSEPPDGYGMIGSQRIQLIKGTYRWNNVIADSPSPPNLIKHGYGPLAMANGAAMFIHFQVETKPDNIYVYQWNDRTNAQTQVPVTDNTFQLPSDPGKYLFEIIVKWSDNEAHYAVAFYNKYLDMEAAMKEGKRMDPNGDADWSAEFIENKEIEINNQKQTYSVWEIKAVYHPYGNKMIITIDAVTGKQIMLTEIEAPGM